MSQPSASPPSPPPATPPTSRVLAFYGKCVMALVVLITVCVFGAWTYRGHQVNQVFEAYLEATQQLLKSNALDRWVRLEQRTRSEAGWQTHTLQFFGKVGSEEQARQFKGLIVIDFGEIPFHPTFYTATMHLDWLTEQPGNPDLKFIHCQLIPQIRQIEINCDSYPLEYQLELDEAAINVALAPTQHALWVSEFGDQLTGKWNIPEIRIDIDALYQFKFQENTLRYEVNLDGTENLEARLNHLVQGRVDAKTELQIQNLTATGLGVLDDAVKTEVVFQNTQINTEQQFDAGLLNLEFDLNADSIEPEFACANQAAFRYQVENLNPDAYSELNKALKAMEADDPRKSQQSSDALTNVYETFLLDVLSHNPSVASSFALTQDKSDVFTSQFDYQFHTKISPLTAQRFWQDELLLEDSRMAWRLFISNAFINCPEVAQLAGYLDQGLELGLLTMDEQGDQRVEFVYNPGQAVLNKRDVTTYIKNFYNMLTLMAKPSSS